jgi:thymidylate kinase
VAIVSSVGAAFFDELNRSGIRYCHWKSNLRLDESLEGKRDLDLLIDPRDEEAFRALAKRLHLQQLLDPGGKPCPGIEDWFSLDPETGRMVHFHVHYGLFVGPGDDRIYRLPLEEALIASAAPRQLCDVRVPSPEMELLMLCVRAILKLNRRALSSFSIFRPRRKRPAPLKRDVVKELQQLAPMVDGARFREVQQTHSAYLPPRLVETVLDFASGKSVERRTLVALRKDLLRRLEPTKQVSTVRLALWKLRRRFRALFSRRRQPVLAGGGLTVAVVGSDGSGKSTVIGDLKASLSPRMRLRILYMGSKNLPWSVRRFRSLRNRTHKWRKWARNHPWVGSKAQSALAALDHIAYALFYLSIGWRRRANERRGRRAASRGELVLYDRYPLPEFHSIMDGPYIPSRFPAGGKGIEFLTNVEKRLYEHIPPPDVVFVIDIDPEEALRRKPDHEEEMVQRKTQALETVEIRSTRAIRINGNRPREEVIQDVRRRLWEVLELREIPQDTLTP